VKSEEKKNAKLEATTQKEVTEKMEVDEGKKEIKTEAPKQNKGTKKMDVDGEKKSRRSKMKKFKMRGKGGKKK